MEDLRQTKEYRKYMDSLGWQTEAGIFIKNLAFLPWSVIKYQRPSWPVDFKRLKKIAKKHRAAWIKIEPNCPADEKSEKGLIKQGFKKDKVAMLPSKTIWLDLNKSEQKLLKEMHYKTKYNLRKHQGKIKIKIVRGDRLKDKELAGFFKIYQKNCQRQKFWGVSFKQLKNLLQSFGKKSYLISSKDLGGLILLLTDKAAYYAHNAVNQKGREKFAATLLTWEAIKLAKKLGKTRFDFEGIEDERSAVTRKWQGFSRFKKGFGGDEVEYMGSFSKWRFK